MGLGRVSLLFLCVSLHVLVFYLGWGKSKAKSASHVGAAETKLTLTEGACSPEDFPCVH